ncbi:hypothetical protein NHQ30_002887 [Ciborinia camelliae]|nr:hypothetical protein NHQ30_002887 [Ciborinia camelliae]
MPTYSIGPEITPYLRLNLNAKPNVIKVHSEVETAILQSLVSRSFADGIRIKELYSRFKSMKNPGKIFGGIQPVDLNI